MISRRLLWPALAAGIAVLFWVTNRGPAVPTLTWRIGASDGERDGKAYDELAPDAAVRLQVAAGTALHVHVASVSNEDGTLTWFPSPMLNSDVQNPLPRGRTTLPGHRLGQVIAWPTRPGLAVTTWLVVAAEQPLADLTAAMAQLRQASNTTFTDGSVVLSHPKDGSKPQGMPGSPPPHALLQEALALPPTGQPNGPMRPARGNPGVWLASWQTLTAKNAAGERPQPSPLDKLQPVTPPK